MALVVVLGTAGSVYSRDQRQPDNTRPLAAGPGRAGAHWHAAIGFYLCDTFAPSPPDTGQDPLGIHSHGDGIVHIHPFSSQAAGRRATLDIFFDTVGVEASDDRLELPGQDARESGDKCGDQTAQIRTKVWDSRDPQDQGRIVPGNPGDVRPTDGMLITIALVAEGADIPRPPHANNLDNLTDVDPPPAAATTSTTAGTSTTVDGSSSTTVAADPTATVPPTTAAAPTTTAVP